MRGRARFWVVLLASLAPAVLLLLSGCGGPSGAAGFRWGDDADDAVRRVTSKPVEWGTWFQDFESTSSNDLVLTIYGRRAYLTLVRRGRSIEGVQLGFAETDHAGWLELRRQVVDEYGLSRASAESDCPYDTFSDDSLVRLDGWTLTVAGPVLGKAYQSYILAQGLSGLFRIHH